MPPERTGNEGGSIIGGRGEVISAEATKDYWISVNQIDSSDPIVRQLPDHDPDDGSVVICEEYPSLGTGANVRFCRVQGGGHTMPSIKHRVVGRQNHDAEGARLAWDFFMSQ